MGVIQLIPPRSAKAEISAQCKNRNFGLRADISGICPSAGFGLVSAEHKETQLVAVRVTHVAAVKAIWETLARFAFIRGT